MGALESDSDGGEEPAADGIVGARVRLRVESGVKVRRLLVEDIVQARGDGDQLTDVIVDEDSVACRGPPRRRPAFPSCVPGGRVRRPQWHRRR